MRVNGDLAFFAGANRALLEREDANPGTVLDQDFIDKYCDGFQAAATAWRGLDWDGIEADSGLSRKQIEDFVSDVVAADSVIVCWAMGLTQHRNAVATIREIVNFLLLRGNIGRPGAGAAPIRGHSNVQGDRTMGIWEKMPDAFLDKLRDEFGFDPPREHGWDTVDTIRAMRDGKVDVFMALGGNFAAATPDTAVTEAALANCALTVHVATKLNRSHLCHGREALILPCLGRTERDERGGREQFVTVEDSMSVVHSSRGRLQPGSGQLRSEVAIVTGLGHALFGDGHRLGRRWARTTPSSASTSSTSCRASTPTRSASAHRADSCCRTARATRARSTPRRGSARFTVNPPDTVEVPEGHLLLQTVRSHDQFNTTVYGLDDRYRGIKGGRRVVFVNTDDLSDRRPARRRPRRPDQRLDRRRAPGARLPGRRVRDPAGLRGSLLPGGERAGAAGLHRRGQQHAGVEVDRDPPGAGGLIRAACPRCGAVLGVSRRAEAVVRRRRPAPRLAVRPAWFQPALRRPVISST